MDSQSRTATSDRPEGARHEQVDRRPFELQLPDPGLWDAGALLAQPEVSALHGFGEQRSIVQEVGIDSEVAIGGRAWDGDIRLADTQVDRLRPDEHECLDVSLEGGERVQQGTARGDRFLSFARHLRSSPST